MLNISNNKRRSLFKSEYIINIDFPEELINKYRIYDEAILVNIGDKINISSKRFNGINVNYYKIKVPEECKIANFSDEIVYESLIYGIKDFKLIKNKIIKDEICIDKFIGNKGMITENNLKKRNKDIDKTNIKE